MLGPKTDAELQVAVGTGKVRAPLLRAGGGAGGASEVSTEAALDLGSATRGARNLVVKIKRKKHTLACARLPLATLPWSADEPAIDVDARAELASRSRGTEASSLQMKLRITFQYAQVSASEQVPGGQAQRVRFVMGKKEARSTAAESQV